MINDVSVYVARSAHKTKFVAMGKQQFLHN